MKFSISWLKEHLDTNASVEEIAQTLTRIGLEVEEVFDPAAKLDGFVTAKVEECSMHPDSDHLHLLCVDTGKEKLQVVCGAPNVKKGTIGIFAPVGAVIPSFGEKLGVGKIRGIESFGMLCSEKELCLGEDHNGIISLDEHTPVGVAARDVLAIDPVIEIAITPNRAECLGVRGIARDLSAAGIGKLKPLDVKKIEATTSCPIKVEVKDALACPVYAARYIKNVNNKAETPKWLKDRLAAIGLHSISPLVDITNYINYDMAHPLHVFDADKLKGNLVIRMASEGEKFVSLDNKEYTLDNQSLGICDDDGIQCLAGIMGGAQKGCSDETSSVLLESAIFSPESIARTGRKFQIDSDSRYRYERWVDPNSSTLVSDYAAAMILEICGGEVSEIVLCGEEKYSSNAVYMRIDRVKTLVGLDVAPDKVINILKTLGFEVSLEGQRLKAVAPSWRGDIEVEADLVEEIVRMVGLDNIEPLSIPRDNLPAQTLTAEQMRVVTIRHELAAKGMFETVTWSFADSKMAQHFRNGNQAILLTNPIASELDEMRPSALPNLLLACKNNAARGADSISLFEVGPQFYGYKPGEQKLVAAGIRYGLTGKKHWLNESRVFDVFDAKADAMAAVAAANGPCENLQITTDAPEYYHPGRSGALRLGKTVVAYFGELSPVVLKALDIKGKVMAFEVFVDSIPLARAASGKAKKKLELPQLQPVEKDLAFVADKSVAAINIVVAAKNADRDYITDVRVFDVYEGEHLPDGKKSIALGLTFQPKDKTFTDQEIEGLMKKVILEVGKKTNAILR